MTTISVLLSVLAAASGMAPASTEACVGVFVAGERSRIGNLHQVYSENKGNRKTYSTCNGTSVASRSVEHWLAQNISCALESLGRPLLRFRAFDQTCASQLWIEPYSKHAEFPRGGQLRAKVEVYTRSLNHSDGHYVGEEHDVLLASTDPELASLENLIDIAGGNGGTSSIVATVRNSYGTPRGVEGALADAVFKLEATISGAAGAGHVFAFLTPGLRWAPSSFAPPRYYVSMEHGRAGTEWTKIVFCGKDGNRLLFRESQEECSVPVAAQTKQLRVRIEQ